MPWSPGSTPWCGIGTGTRRRQADAQRRPAARRQCRPSAAVLKLRNGGVDIETLVSETIGLEGVDIAKLGHTFDKPPMSLRQIAEETNLGLNTVRTIIAQAKRTDRTTRKHLARVEPEAIDRQRLAHWGRKAATTFTHERRGHHLRRDPTIPTAYSRTGALACSRAVRAGRRSGQIDDNF